MSVRRSGDIGELNTLVYVSLVANNVGWLLYGLVMKVSTVFDCTSVSTSRFSSQSKPCADP